MVPELSSGVIESSDGGADADADADADGSVARDMPGRFLPTKVYGAELPLPSQHRFSIVMSTWKASMQ